MRRLAAEHGWPLDGGEVIALTVDGIGMGENGALWGGECLRVNYRECEHLGGLPAVALPGGDLAAKHPWRNLLAQCLRFVPDWQDYPETAGLQQQNWNVWRAPLSAASMPHWRLPAGGCLTRWLPRFAARQHRLAMRARPPARWRRWPLNALTLSIR